MYFRIYLMIVASLSTMSLVAACTAQEQSVSKQAADVVTKDGVDSDHKLQELAGKWRPTSAISVKPVDESDEISKRFLNEIFTAEFITIEGNQLLPHQCYFHTSPAALTVDFSAPQFRPVIETPPSNGQLLMLTTMDGKATFASFNLTQESLTLRYPAGCCSRSGCVVTYARVTDEKE